MADQPSPRRCFQFRLRTLFVVTAAIAVVCWNASLTRGNLWAFYALNTSEFFVLLIVARIKIWFSRKGPGEYKTFY
jgi:hypothetical protein